MQRIDFKRIKSGDYYPQKMLNAFIFGIIPAILIYYYRRGGVVDGYVKNDSLRDLNVWLTAGKEILRGNSPYNDPGHWMKSGSLTTTIYGLLGEVLPNIVLYLGSQMLTFVGIWMFISKVMIKDLKNAKVVFVLTELSSPFRENLVDIQLTGHILFLISLGVIFWTKYEESHLTKYKFLTLFFFLLSIDLKPNLTLIFVLTFLFTRKVSSRIYLSMITIYLTSYATLSILTKTNLLSEWIRVLLSISDGSKNTDIYGSVSIWQALNNLPGVNYHLGGLSIILFSTMALFALYLVKINQAQLARDISILAPFFYSFFQFYSFTPIFILLVLCAIKFNRYYFLGFIIGIFTFVQGLNKPSNILIQLLILVLIANWLRVDSPRRSVPRIYLGGLIGFLINYFSLGLWSDSFERVSLLCTLAILIYCSGFRSNSKLLI